MGLCSIAQPLDFPGGPYRNRTCNLLIKSQLLCLVELTALVTYFYRRLEVCVTILKRPVNFFLQHWITSDKLRQDKPAITKKYINYPT